MKTSKIQKNTSSNSHSSKPFFNKSGEGTFISQSQEVENPFFTPSMIQTKLTIGKPGDEYEQEADSIAEKVVNQVEAPKPSPIVQTKCEACEEEKIDKKTEEEDALMRKPIFESCGDPPENQIQTKSDLPSIQLSPELESSLQSQKGKGSRLPEDTRNEMESRFGEGFGRVRIHTDQNAVQMNQDLSAQAFTHGSDIYFDRGKYDPESKNGKKLLAHELTHVVQQNRNGELIQRNPDPASQIDFDSITSVEETLDEAISRLRNWLTHNLSLFLTDVMMSDNGNALETLRSDGFGSALLRTMIGDAFAVGGTLAGSYGGGRKLIRFFLVLRTARVFGGVIGFIVSSIIETIVASFFDRTNQILSESAESIRELVIMVINPGVDSIGRELRGEFRTLRDRIRELDEPVNFWRELRTALGQVEENYESSIPDIRDESLYRQLALQTGVYSGQDVVAESEEPQGITGQESQFEFSMQHRMVDTGRTRINVTEDNSTVVIRSQAFDCLRGNDGEFSPVDARGESAAPSWLLTPPASIYTIMLLRRSSSLFGEISSEFHIPRRFNVNATEYGIWHRVPRGTYSLRIYRGGYHPVALCGEGGYRVESGS